MARLAVSMALVLLFVAFAYATDDSANASPPTTSPRLKSYFTAPVIALSPAQQEKVAQAPSTEDESDPDAGTVGSSGAHYPPSTGNILALAPSGALAPTAHALSSKGVPTFGVSSLAATLSVIAVSSYFAF